MFSILKLLAIRFIYLSITKKIQEVKRNWIRREEKIKRFKKYEAFK